MKPPTWCAMVSNECRALLLMFYRIANWVILCKVTNFNIKKNMTTLNGFNMFHLFAFTYYILLRCVTREYSVTSVTTKNYSIYATREYATTNDEKYSIYATREYTTIFDLHDTYYSLLERT